MSEITVRVLSEDEWEQYREFRLKSLRDSPEAFVANYETENEFDEKLWRARMRRSFRLLAEQDGSPVGIASLRESETLFEGAAELFGLWVEPALRGSGVAAKLVVAASDAAEKHGRSQLVYWVAPTTPARLRSPAATVSGPPSTAASRRTPTASPMRNSPWCWRFAAERSDPPAAPLPGRRRR
ncbi:GNAT family N-acetyltransferase [Gephyromycinifex aptenodytis]|uniref:GNAT family N-acetyltransferase n=1 Tax=Gephyromycinifex aptenodytis TaxID=2716227 RepID=UPI0029CA7017|nr:GNAT family N-acetyltransferase [Gephyromycinifex aptenodytis]